MRETEQYFQKQFGHRPTHVVRAPGRLELLGNHTDYNEGLVLSLAVDRYLFMATSPRADGHVELASSAMPEHEKFPLDQLARNPVAPWADYVKGVLEQLRHRGVRFSGFNAALHSTLPVGAGMSSSAALTVSTALSVRKLFPYTLTSTGVAEPPRRDRHGDLPPLSAKERVELAKLCQAAENDFVGVKCGLLDQLSVLFGRASHAMEIDFQRLTVNPVPFIGEVTIVICNSGVKHALTGGEYNRLRQHCESAAKALGARTLRQVEPRALAAGKNHLSPRDYECASHVVGEIQRVVLGERALRDGDFEQFGQYMFQSHESSRDLFKNSCAELDLLVDLARGHSGCLGARLTGGGFGGATINLVRRGQVGDFTQTLAQQYEQRTGQKLKPLLCQIVDGAR